MHKSAMPGFASIIEFSAQTTLHRPPAGKTTLPAPSDASRGLPEEPKAWCSICSCQIEEKSVFSPAKIDIELPKRKKRAEKGPTDVNNLPPPNISHSRHFEGAGTTAAHRIRHKQQFGILYLVSLFPLSIFFSFRIST